MFFEDFVSPCQDFDEKIKDRRPLFIRKERPFFKKKLTDMVSWKKINEYLNSQWNIEELVQDWNDHNRINCSSNLDTIDPRIYEIRDHIENCYDDGYQCEVWLIMHKDERDFCEIHSSETDGFFLQLIGSSDWEVYPKRAKEPSEEWQDDDNDLYIPIVEKTTMESDIIYLPKNIFSRTRPRSASVMLRFNVFKPTKPFKKEGRKKVYDFMPIRGKVLNEDRANTFDE